MGRETTQTALRGDPKGFPGANAIYGAAPSLLSCQLLMSWVKGSGIDYAPSAAPSYKPTLTLTLPTVLVYYVGVGDSIIIVFDIRHTHKIIH